MHEEPISNQDYLKNIYEQNQKIISLLEHFFEHNNPKSVNAEEQSIRKINLEKMNSLSPREHQIIELILEGKLNKEIAYAFSISVSTVESHRSNIMRKLGAKNVAQLIKIYLQCQEPL